MDVHGLGAGMVGCYLFGCRCNARFGFWCEAGAGWRNAHVHIIQEIVGAPLSVLLPFVVAGLIPVEVPDKEVTFLAGGVEHTAHLLPTALYHLLFVHVWRYVQGEAVAGSDGRIGKEDPDVVACFVAARGAQYPAFCDVAFAGFQGRGQFGLHILVPIGGCVALAVDLDAHHGATAVCALLATAVFSRMCPTLAVVLGAEMVWRGLRGGTPPAHVRVELGGILRPATIGAHRFLEPGVAHQVGHGVVLQGALQDVLRECRIHDHQYGGAYKDGTVHENKTIPTCVARSRVPGV